MEAVIAVMGVIVAAIFALLGVLIGHLFGRIHKLEERMEAKWIQLRDAAEKERRLNDHMDVLEHHIWQEMPPPPPSRPEGL